MKKKILYILLLTLLASPLYAQIRTINLDIVTGKINGGNPIPAEEEFYIRGSVPDNIEMVKLKVYPAKKTEKAGNIYFWKTPFGYKELSYQLLVSDPLRASQEYALEFGFYQKAGKEQIDEVRSLIGQNIKSYLSTVITVRKRKLKFSESNEVILNNLEQIVEQGALYFELPNGEQFSGFSDITRAKLEQGGKLKLGKAKFNLSKVEEDENERAVYAAQYIEELNGIITAEVDQYLSPNMLVLVDEMVFENYKTENTPNSIPINVGYGAISLSKGLPNQEFVHSPYVGLSFPLGNRTFARFMHNLSISTGVFLSGNMENAMNEKITGPLVDRPVYVGLGYNFFRIIRLNAGGTFITTERNQGSNMNSFQPFVGLSAEFNIWLGIGKKR